MTLSLIGEDASLIGVLIHHQGHQRGMQRLPDHREGLHHSWVTGSTTIHPAMREGGATHRRRPHHHIVPMPGGHPVARTTIVAAAQRVSNTPVLTIVAPINDHMLQRLAQRVMPHDHPVHAMWHETATSMCVSTPGSAPGRKTTGSRHYGPSVC